jgi:hypothetical protein
LEGTISDAAQFAVADADAARLAAADADATRGVTECYGCSAKRYVDGYSYGHAGVSKRDACFADCNAITAQHDADVNLDYHPIVAERYANGNTNDDASSDADAGPVDGCAHGYGCTRET